MQTIDRYQGSQLAVEADYSYDSAGRLTALVYHQGTTVLTSYSYSYAGSPLPSGEGHGEGGTASSPLTSGEGQGVRASWLPAGAMLPEDSTQGIDAGQLDQGLSAEELVASVTTLSGSVAYSYDAEGQLTAASYSSNPQSQIPNPPSESYSYDANGNRTSSTSSAAVVIGPDNEVLFDGTYTYTYDANGNCTAKFIDVHDTGVLSSGDTNMTQYTWDAAGRLVQVTQIGTYGGAPTQVVTYLYNAEGRWIGENVANGSGVITHETRFVYDGNQIVLQFDYSPLPPGEGQGEGDSSQDLQMTNADLSHRYLWGPAVDQILSDEQLSPHPSGEGQGEGDSGEGEGYNVSAPGTLVLPLTDNVGTVRDLAICDLTSGTMSVVNHLTYNSFGQLLNQTNPATGNAAAADCLFGFTGRAFDNSTGLQNNLSRWYDFGVGRWLSDDPTGFAASDTNEYRYCGNSPANATDPSGLSPNVIIWINPTDMPKDFNVAAVEAQINATLKARGVTITVKLMQTTRPKSGDFVGGAVRTEKWNGITT